MSAAQTGQASPDYPHHHVIPGVGMTSGKKPRPNISIFDQPYNNNSNTLPANKVSTGASPIAGGIAQNSDNSNMS